MSTKLLAALANMRAAMAAFEAAVAEESAARAVDPLLGLPELKEHYNVGRGAVLAAVGRGELTASRGPRGAILVSQFEVERWLRARPVTAPQTKPASTLDSWESAADSMLSNLAPRAHANDWQ